MIITTAAHVLLVLLATGAPQGVAGSPEPPAEAAAATIREIVVEGATVYDHAQVLRFIRVREGDKLWRDAAQHAATLQDRYHSGGYLGARVAGGFESSTGTLRLKVDEGHLAELVLDGVEPSAQEAVRERLGLVTGALLRESDVRAAVARLEDASLGAFERADWPNYAVDPSDAGARLTLRFVQRHVRLGIVPGAAINPVDGVQPSVALELTRYDARSFSHANVYLRAAYGFRSDDLRWAAGVRRPFGTGDRVTVGYEHHDLTDSDDVFRMSMFEQAPATMLLFAEAGDYYRRRGDEVYAFVSVSPRLQLGAAFRGDEHESLFEKDEDDVVTPAIDGRSHSLVGTVRLARGGPLFESARRQRESFLQRDLFGTRLERRNTLRAEASLEWASAETLGGDFTFSRLLLNVRGERAASTLLRLRARGLAGFTGGEPPPQRGMRLGGPGTLRARPFAGSTGDHALVVNLEAALAAPRPWPGPVAFYDGGVAWGERSSGLGWQHDLGLGLEWPAGSNFFLRVDGAWALDPEPQTDRFRFGGRVRLPF